MTPGQSLAHYRIAGKIGQGGMGEVYRATDTRLGREVAIKVLPPAFAEDSVRMARFEREAQMLAALNHPNIAGIYGIEQGALVMEYVEGDDLKGPLPIDTVLDYARQIAEALEAAHEKGIIHRDLKPANIKVTPASQVKLLDFGLAKASEEPPGSPSASPTLSPTLSLAMTQAGMILGTAAYMSPEQARGKTVDRRADIWAYGVVLFEMLTGRPLFGGGDTVTDTIAAVVRDEPDWAALPKNTPPRIRRLIERCLRKDPKQRLRDIGEARLAIDEPEPAAAPTLSVTARRGWLPWAVAGIVLLAAAVFGGILLLRPKPAEPGAIQFTFAIPEGTGSFSYAAAAQAVPSPDGRHIAFIAVDSRVGKSQLWIRPLSGLSAQRLDRTEDAHFPFWSPDSQTVGFFADQKLKRVSISMGTPQTICDVGSDQGDGASWGPDGVILFAGGLGPLMRVAAGGGTPAPVTTLDSAGGETRHSWPQFLPDGRNFIYFVGNLDSAKAAIHVQELGTRAGRKIFSSQSRAVFARPGHLFFIREGTLFAQPINLKTYQLEKEPAALAEDVNANSGNGRSSFSVSDTGLVVYRANSSPLKQLTWYDRQGKKLRTVGEPTETHGFTLAPDEKRVALIRHEKTFMDDIWLMDLATGIQTRATFNAKRATLPVWSPDSQSVVFGGGRTGGIERLILGSPKSTSVVDGPDCSIESWSPDGRSLIGYTASGVFLLPVLPDGTAEGKPQMVAQSPFTKRNFRFSPDGRSVAFLSAESGPAELYVASFPTFADRQRVSSSGASGAEWSKDSKGLIFYSGGTLLWADIKTSPKIEVGLPKPMFPVNTAGARDHFAVARDGNILVAESLAQQDAVHFNVLVNWTAALKH